MALQKKVGTAAALGVPGDKAVPDQSTYTPKNFLAGGNGTAAGSFCWASADGTAAENSTSGSDAPLGFVERNQVYPAYDAVSEGTLVIPAGCPLMVAVRGDYFAAAQENCTRGGKVYADKTSGKVLAAAGSNGILADGWFFETSGKAGDTVIISRQ